jgi:spermidine synthase
VVVSLVVGAAALWWGSRTRRRASLAVMLIVSAAAMALETAALLRYQVANGVMFVNVGGLLTCFMAGMAVGSWAGGGPATRRRLDAHPCLIAVAVLLAAAGVLLMTHWTALAGLAGTGALLAITGVVAGGTFAAMTDDRPGDPSRAVGSLYAADVAGGALGAWLAPLVVVPTLGLDGTAVLAAVAAVALVPLCVILGGRR